MEDLRLRRRVEGRLEDVRFFFRALLDPFFLAEDLEPFLIDVLRRLVGGRALTDFGRFKFLNKSIERIEEHMKLIKMWVGTTRTS